jgi:hypothetical protein
MDASDSNPDSQSLKVAPPLSPTTSRRFTSLVLAIIVGVVVGIAGQRAIGYFRNDHNADGPLLKVWLLMGSHEHVLDSGQIALPTGGKFQIKVISTQSGQLALYAINPVGVRSAQPLWSGMVQSSMPLTTEFMRLEGTRGKETLLLELKAASSGAVLGQSQLYLWHM